MTKLSKILWYLYPWKEAYLTYRDVCWNTDTPALNFRDWLKNGGWRFTQNLDPGIAEIVHLLQRHKINTFASCQGGKGHAFDKPTIRIYPKDYNNMHEESLEVARILTDNCYGGFYLKCIESFQLRDKPWQPDKNSFIEVEFWRDYE